MSNNEFSNPETGSFQPIYPNQGQQPPAQQQRQPQQPQPQPQQQPQFMMQPTPTYVYAAPAASPQQNSGTSPAMIALISVLAVVLLGLVGAIFYVTLGKDDATNAASTQAAVNSQGQGQQAQQQPQQIQQPPVTQTETVVVPSSGGSGSSGYSDSSRSLAGGNLSSAWKGTSTTSDPFVRNVHSAYVRYRRNTGAESGTITAYSPTTGLTYDMWCRPSGSNIKCTGGRNAVVYIG